MERRYGEEVWRGSMERWYGEVASLSISYMLRLHAIPYTVVYGHGPLRTANALHAVRDYRAATPNLSPPGASNWQWHCENCSDAACEHRLFSDLNLKAGSMRL